MSGATSSRVRIGSYLLRIYPYPAHGGLGPVGGGSKGRREAAGDPGMVNHTRAGKGLIAETVGSLSDSSP